MSCSSRYGIFIPTTEVSENVAIKIIQRIDKIGSLSKAKHFGMDIKSEVIEKQWLFFTRKKVCHKYVNVDRTDPDFTNKAVRQYIDQKYICLWQVDDALNKALVNDDCVAKNKQLWTPEDVSVSHGKMAIDLDEEIPETSGIVIALWGYGYFFPYSVDQVSRAIEGFPLWGALVDVGREIAGQVVVGEIGEISNEMGFIRKIDKTGVYSFADQSF